MTQSIVLSWLRMLALLLAAGPVLAAPVRYQIDPAHTYPSFEADHLGGVSTWRGKFNTTTGWVELDRTAGAGRVELAVEMDSVDFGHNLMNTVARSGQLFDVERFPQARYTGRLTAFVSGQPTRLEGELTLRDVTRPVVLDIDRFKCVPHPLFRRELCGANAIGRLDREAFGLDLGKSYGFNMDVDLRIQVEAVAEPASETTNETVANPPPTAAR